MVKEENLPSQVKETILELENLAKLDPLEGTFVLVGQNGHLEKYTDSFRSSFVGSGLIDPEAVSLTLKSVGYPGSIFHHLGHPELWGKPRGESGYEVESRFDRNGIKIEAFVIVNEDPTGFMAFVPRQDFTLFYSLFDRVEDQNRVWDDHMRGVSDVIKLERSEMLSKIKVSKAYLLDYIFIRKKALLLGYYFDIVVPARTDVPIDFFKRINYDIDKGNVRIAIARPKISPEQLIARLDMFKVILPPPDRTLGDFGTMAEAPKVTLKTSEGPVEMSKVGTNSSDISDFLATAYFSSEVLKNYEEDRRYHIDDNGGVHYAGVWGIFRGIRRLGDEVIAAHVGDVAEGLPYAEWANWASHNIDPLSTDEHRELGEVVPIQQLLNFLVSGIEAFERRQLFFIARKGVQGDEPLFKFESPEQREEVVRELKKTFTRRTTGAEFLNRTVELYKLCVDSLNRGLLTPIIDRYDLHAKFDYNGHPKGSLKLLLTYLELQAIERVCSASGLNNKNMMLKIVDCYNRLSQPDFKGAEDFLLQEAQERVNALRKAFGVLFALHAFRSKAGGAHLGSSTQFTQAMDLLGFADTETNFLRVYRELIIRLTSFFSQV